MNRFTLMEPPTTQNVIYTRAILVNVNGLDLQTHTGSILPNDEVDLDRHCPAALRVTIGWTGNVKRRGTTIGRMLAPCVLRDSLTGVAA